MIAYLVMNFFDAKVISNITKWLKEHLTDYKIPNQIYVVAEIPRNRRNKIVRDQLVNLVPIAQYKIQ